MTMDEFEKLVMSDMPVREKALAIRAAMEGADKYLQEIEKHVSGRVLLNSDVLRRWIVANSREINETMTQYFREQKGD